jgi:hypothetical protein
MNSILPLTVLRRFDCLLAPKKESALKRAATLKGWPTSLGQALSWGTLVTTFVA